MRIASWNVNSIRSRADHLQRWLTLRKLPEILCLQETKVQDNDFPEDIFEKYEYSVVYHGQKTYNGVAIASKYEIQEVSHGMENAEVDGEARVIAATIEGVRIINVYVPNGSMPQSEKYVWKFQFLKAFEEYIAKELATYKEVVIVGDFNIAPEEIDVWNPEMFQGHIMFTEAERNWFSSFQRKYNLHDTFRVLHPEAKEYSWFDYRTKAFLAKRGWRIDFALVTPSIMQKVEGAVIDYEPRGWEKPSDHCPIVIKLRT